jgi:hypothetical protein
MSETSYTVFVCDLCKCESRKMEHGVVPAHWVKLVLDHHMEERATVTRHVCGTCADKVVAQIVARPIVRNPQSAIGGPREDKA